jgi:hypothetical protein
VSWDEALADRYDDWSAGMTGDIPFHVRLAREADGPVVELAVATTGSRSRSRWSTARSARSCASRRVFIARKENA